MTQRTRRHPTEWLRRDALGMYLTLGLVVLSALGWVFGEITEAVVKGDDVVAVDSPVTHWLVEHRVPWLTWVMLAVTQLGSAWFVITLVAIVTLVLVGRRSSRSLMLIVPLSAAGASLLVTVVKLLIARPRPTIGDVVAVANGFSFPSGHSAQAVATYAALAWVVTRGLFRRGARTAVWLAAGVIVLLIGFSRLYLGVHWLSDVIGGYTIGACWLVVVVTSVVATQHVRRTGRSPASSQSPASGDASG